MKIRTGFVSNSSSSSFIVAFPNKPENAEDVKKMLFPKGNEEYHLCRACYPYAKTFWSTKEVSETVWNDIKNQIPNNLEEMVESINCGWFTSYKGLPGRYEISHKEEQTDSINSEEWRKIWNKSDSENKKRATDIAEQFIQDNKGCAIYVFSYSDNEGEYGCALEHGGLFDNLKHIVTSYH